MQGTSKIAGAKEGSVCTPAYSVQGVISRRPRSMYTADGKQVGQGAWK